MAVLTSTLAANPEWTLHTSEVPQNTVLKQQVMETAQSPSAGERVLLVSTAECERINRERECGTSLAVQWLRLHLPMQGVRVRSLVWELRSHMPRGRKTKS